MLSYRIVELLLYTKSIPLMKKK